MASRKNIEEIIDHIINGWNSRFGKLQKHKENGQAVDENDVRKVVLATGEDIYKSGLSFSAAENTGYKTDEIKSVFQRVTEKKMPASSVVSGLQEDVQVNAIQAAALNNTSGSEQSAIISAIKDEAEFMPLAGGVGAGEDPNTALVNSEVEDDDDVMERATGVAKNILGEDPNTTGGIVTVNDSITPVAQSASTDIATGIDNTTEGTGNSATGIGQVPSGISNPATESEGASPIPQGVNSGDATVPADAAAQQQAALDAAVLKRSRRDVPPVIIPQPPAAIVEPTAPAGPTPILVTDVKGVTRDISASSAADQATITAFMANGGAWDSIDAVAAIYNSGDPVAIANWEAFANAGGGPAATPIRSTGTTPKPDPIASAPILPGMIAGPDGQLWPVDPYSSPTNYKYSIPPPSLAGSQTSSLDVAIFGSPPGQGAMATPPPDSPNGLI